MFHTQRKIDFCITAIPTPTGNLSNPIHNNKIIETYLENYSIEATYHILLWEDSVL